MSNVTIERKDKLYLVSEDREHDRQCVLTEGDIGTSVEITTHHNKIEVASRDLDAVIELLLMVRRLRGSD